MVVITRKSKPEVGGRRARRAHGPAKEGKNNNVSRAAVEAPPLNLWQNNGEDQEDLANIFTRKKKKVKRMKANLFTLGPSQTHTKLHKNGSFFKKNC